MKILLLILAVAISVVSKAQVINPDKSIRSISIGYDDMSTGRNLNITYHHGFNDNWNI